MALVKSCAELRHLLVASTQITNRFFRSLIAELIIGPIGQYALFPTCNGKVNESFNSDQIPGDGPMKTHLIVLGTVLLSTALLFGMEVGITALVLNFS
jgi:hypothetical protein